MTQSQTCVCVSVCVRFAHVLPCVREQIIQEESTCCALASLLDGTAAQRQSAAGPAEPCRSVPGCALSAVLASWGKAAAYAQKIK